MHSTTHTMTRCVTRAHTNLYAAHAEIIFHTAQSYRLQTIIVTGYPTHQLKGISDKDMNIS